MPTSYSKCPSQYVRPKLLVIHGEKSYIRDMALYFAGQLAIGGYAQLQVVPCFKCGEVSKMSVKELKQFLQERGIEISRGCERAELLELAQKNMNNQKILSTCSHELVVRYKDTHKFKAPATSLYDIDLKICDDWNQVNTSRLAMAILCTSTKEEAISAGKLLAQSVKPGKDSREPFPIIFLAPPGPIFYESLESCFEEEEAVPLKNQRNEFLESKDEEKEGISSQEPPRPRNLDGMRVIVRAAFGFCVGRRCTDNALIALSGGGKIALERLDKEREDSLAKYYDLLVTAGLPILFVQRSNLTTVTWGALLVAAPLIAAATLTHSSYREALSENRNFRLIAANATHEVRSHLLETAQRVQRKVNYNTSIYDNSKKKKKHHRLWRPAIDIGQHLALFLAYEWALCAPDSIFTFLTVPFILAAPYNTRTPDCANILIAHLRSAICTASTTNLDALERALKNKSENFKGAQDIHVPTGTSLVPRSFYFACAAFILIVLLIILLALLVELSFPDITGSATRAFFSSNGPFVDEILPPSQLAVEPKVIASSSPEEL